MWPATAARVAGQAAAVSQGQSPPQSYASAGWPEARQSEVQSPPSPTHSGARTHLTMYICVAMCVSVSGQGNGKQIIH